MKKIFTISTMVFIVLISIKTVYSQTVPTPQPLPYTQDFTSLATGSVTTYPAGWQGWQISTSGSSTNFRTNAATANLTMTASGTGGSTMAGVYNYTHKLGFLSSSASDPAVCLAVNTTGQSSVSVTFDVSTIRNPFNGTTETRRNNVELQFCIGGAVVAFTSLTGSIYRNNTTLQTSGTTASNARRMSFLLPASCDNQAVVQLRWVQRDSVGSGSRPGFALDNVIVCAAPTISATVSPTCSGLRTGSVVLNITGGMAPYTVVWDTINTTGGPNFAVTTATKTSQHPYFGVGFGLGYVIDGLQGKELKLTRGVTYGFIGTFSNHPFHISTSSVGGSFSNEVTSGTTNNFMQTGLLQFTPNLSHADSVWYQCGFHPNMGWKLRINNGYATQNLLNAAAGTYTASVKTADGCISTITVTIGSTANPSLTVANNGPRCLGDSTQMTASTNNSYNWVGPNGFSSTLQNPKIFNSSINGGYYSVTVTNANGCTKKDSTFVSFLNSSEITSFSPDSGWVGDPVIITGSNLDFVNSVAFDGIGATFFADNSTQITASVPPNATTGVITITRANGCSNSSLTNFRPLHYAALNLHVLFEGFYAGNGTMSSAVDPTNVSNITDTITVQLYDPADLSQTAFPDAFNVIDRSGNGLFIFPEAAISQSYYIVVKSRNSIETWSKFPILFTGLTNFDFSTPE